MLATSLQSDLKNFFGETCNRVPADKECSVRDISDRTIEYQLLLINLDNCNRDFSATSTGADKNAYIGVRVVQAQDPSEDTLELYLLDDQSTSFLAFLTAYYRYNDKRPVATTSGVYRLFYQIRRRAVISGSPSLCLCPERSSEKVFRKGTICSDPATTDRRNVPRTEFMRIFVGREKSAET